MMVVERVDADARRDDTDVNADDEQRNAGNRIGQFRVVFLAAEHRLHHDLRKHNKHIKTQQIQRLRLTRQKNPHIFDSSHVPQDGLVNRLHNRRTENEHRQQY